MMEMRSASMSSRPVNNRLAGRGTVQCVDEYDEAESESVSIARGCAMARSTDLPLS